LREIAAEQAARDVIAAGLPDVEAEVRAQTDVERGLVVTVKAPLAHRQKLEAELGKLPLTVDIIAA
jgi:hypothetical protein